MAAWSRIAPLFLLAACVTTTPQPPPDQPPPPPPINVPEGCRAPLGGAWVHAIDPSYRYVADDDGGTLTMTVFHELVVDAGFVPRRFRTLDAGTADAGAPDAGPTDAGALDAGTSDAGTPDAGTQALPLEARRVRIELTRTANGFVGETIAPLSHPSGRVCEAHFKTTLLSCADGGLLLETQSATALGDACQAPARPLEQLTQQHPLVRPDAG